MKQTAERVLRILARHDAYVGGEELAAAVGAGRAAVWRAVQSLRRAGEEITAHPRFGYRLTPRPGIRPSALLRAIPALAWAEYHDLISSTNDRAKVLALSGAADKTVVIADAQEAGRGRFDRTFVSPPDAGIYLSVILRPDCPASDAPLLTTCAAVAVAEAIEGLCPCRVGIKWVNDLWINDRKVCGILTEGGLDAEGGRLSWAVIGIGINVRHTAFPPTLAAVATSLQDECGSPVDRGALTAAVLNTLFDRLARFADGSFLADYRARSVLDGSIVAVSRGQETFEATVRGVGDRGELLLLRDGVPLSLSSGEVVRVRPLSESVGAVLKNAGRP